MLNVLNVFNINDLADLLFYMRWLTRQTTEKCQISVGVTMLPGNTAQPVMKSTEDACVK